MANEACVRERGRAWSFSAGGRIQQSRLFSARPYSTYKWGSYLHGLSGVLPPFSLSIPPWASDLLHLFSQPGPVTEVDGAVTTDFFTVLSVGQCYTQDQWLNMQAFSMLRKWLLCYGDKELKTPSSGTSWRAAGQSGLHPQEGRVLCDG